MGLCPRLDLTYCIAGAIPSQYSSGYFDMLTEEMIRILEKQQLGFIASVDEIGAPSISPK